MKRTHDQFKNEHFTAGVLAIAGCFLMVAFPRMTHHGVSRGLELFLGTVLPTMFPFFVLANFLGFTEVPKRIARLLEPLFRSLFRVSGRGAYVVILSLVSGYPMAAKLVGDECRNRSITALEGKKILSFSSVCGPLFMVGTVGTAMLGAPLYGYLIAFGHYTGAMINGFFYSRLLLSQENSVRIKASATAFSGREVPRVSLFGALSQSILRAFSSMGLICGYIILFSVLSEFLTQSRALNRIDHDWIHLILTGMMEMTMGCQGVASAEGMNLVVRLAVCSFFISFGGGSIAGQSLSMLTDSGIGTIDYVKMKLCHGILAGCLTYQVGILAERMGWLDLAASVVYGTESVWIQSFGKLHQLVFTARSMVIVLGLMVLLVGLDHLFQNGYQKVHTYIIERRKNDE